MALAFKEEALRFNDELFHWWRGVCDGSQLAIDEVDARRSLMAHFQSVPKGFTGPFATISFV